MKTRVLTACGLVVALVSQSGCGVDSETLESFHSAVRAVSSSQPQPSMKEASTQQAKAPLEARFDPSFPDRVDPFTFPTSEQVPDNENTSRTTIAAVEILGFAKVGEQHVLLRSGEKSRSLTVGESIDGVRVIEINPPSVRLQMGTLVWNATMFDKADGE